MSLLIVGIVVAFLMVFNIIFGKSYLLSIAIILGTLYILFNLPQSTGVSDTMPWYYTTMCYMIIFFDLTCILFRNEHF